MDVMADVNNKPSINLSLYLRGTLILGRSMDYGKLHSRVKDLVYSIYIVNFHRHEYIEKSLLE